MKIEIRPYEQGDEDELYEVVLGSKEHLRPWAPWCHENYCKNETAHWVEACINAWNKKTSFRYLITDHGDIIGSVGVNDVDLAHRVAELGYWVCVSAIGKGAASTAARLAVIEAFKRQVKRVEILIIPDNIASIRVAEKLGAVREGVFRNRLTQFGKTVDACIYSVIPSDYGFY